MSSLVKKNAKNMLHSARKVFQFRKTSGIQTPEDGSSRSHVSLMHTHTSTSEEDSHHHSEGAAMVGHDDHDHDERNSNHDWQFLSEEGGGGGGGDEPEYASRTHLRDSELSRESLLSTTSNNVCMADSPLPIIPTRKTKKTESDAIIALLSRTQSAVAQSLLVLNNLDILTKEVRVFGIGKCMNVCALTLMLCVYCILLLILINK